MDEGDDFELLRAWQAGDRRAGSELVQRHFVTLYRFFRNKIDDNPKDLIQHTLTTCVEIRDRLPEDVSFRAYALGIARNKLLHHLRRQQRQAHAMRMEATAMVSRVESPSQIIAARQEQRLLLAALRRLPLDGQIAIELFYWEGMKIDEIATVLGVASGTIKSRLSRAKDQLREHITELATTEDLRKSTIHDLAHWVESLREAASEGAS